MGQRELRDAFQRVYGAATQARGLQSCQPALLRVGVFRVCGRGGPATQQLVFCEEGACPGANAANA